MKRLVTLLEERVNYIKLLSDKINNGEINQSTARRLYLASNDTSNSRNGRVVIDEYFNNIGLEYVKKDVLRMIRDYDAMEAFMQFLNARSLNPKDVLISPAEFTRNDNKLSRINSVYRAILRKNENLKKHSKLFRELAAFSRSKNGVTVGGFEVLCSMFIYGVHKGPFSSLADDPKGDIYAEEDNKQYVIEFKTPGARICGQNTYEATKADNYINDFITKKIPVSKKYNYSKVLATSKNMRALLTNTLDSLNVSGFRKENDEYIDFFIDMIINAISAQYSTLIDKYSNIKIDPESDRNIISIKNIIKNDIGSSLLTFNEGNQPSFNDKALDRFIKLLKNLVGCLQLYYYRFDHNFTHIAIFKGSQNLEESVNYGVYNCISANYIENHLDGIFMSTLKPVGFKFRGGGGGGSIRDNYCQIFYY